MLGHKDAAAKHRGQEHLESSASGLKAKGVKFEHYEMPGMTRNGDIHIAGKMRAAWFKDPDGNILCIVSG